MSYNICLENLRKSNLDTNMPAISIGLPVHNGENYLDKALESILNQSYNNFELIISDNASTDNTKTICKYHLKKDKRIRYYRNKINEGAAWNFNNVFHLSSGKYFKWAAHDDILAPDYLLRCIEVMEDDPSIVLCHSEVLIIDEKGEVIKDHPHSSYNFNKKLLNTSNLEPQYRFADLIKMAHPCIDIFGLLRSDILSQTSLIARYIGSDRNLLAELCLYGRFYRIQKNLFYSRMHKDRSIAIRDKKSIARWFDTRNQSRILFPAWRNCKEYFKSVKNSPILLKEKLRCYFSICYWVYSHRKYLTTDIRYGVKEISPEWFLLFYRYMKSLKSTKNSEIEKN